MAVNELAYVLAFAGSALALFLLRKKKWKVSPGDEDEAQKNAQFRSLQKLFLGPYLCVLLAEGIQAPYLYVLYHSYRFVPSQIAVLYVVGLVANLFSSMALVRLLDRHGRRLLCLVCIGCGVVACSLKFSSSLTALLVSRVLDGVAASLVSSPFHEWYVKEHVEHWDFPVDWLSSTFSLVAVLSSFLSVGAGFIAEIAESSSSITAFPFAISVLLLLAGGALVGSLWSENWVAAEERTSKPFAKALALFKKKPVVLLLCEVHALVEAAAQMFVFLWTPLFLHSRSLVHRRLSYGGIYAAFMASSLVGSLLSRLFLQHVPSVRLLVCSLMGALSSFLVSWWLVPQSSVWSLSIFRGLLLSFALFEFSMGVYGHAISRLQADLVPGEQRSALLALLRLPLTVVAGGGMLWLHDGTSHGDSHLLSLCAFLIFFALLLSLLLHYSISSRRDPQQDHLVFSSPAPPSLPEL